MKFVVLSPREEHWDGTGGAISTWVTNVQVPSNLNLTVFGASPANEHSWYKSPRRLQFAKLIISRTSAVFGRLLKVKPKKLENALWLRGLLYVLLLLPELRDAEVIYIHNRPLYAKFLRRLGFSGKLVLHMHNEATGYFKRMSEQQVQQIDAFVFCSDFIRRAAVDRCGVPAERTSVLFNGVANNANLKLSPMGLNLLFVGRLQEIKGPNVAIETVSMLREQGYDATLRLVGGTEIGIHDSLTPFSRSLRQAAETVNAMYGPDTIRFLGPIPLDQVLRVMEDAPILIFPARTEEAFGMVLAEAISRGVYPLVTATGGMPEILDIAGLSPYDSLFTPGEFTNAVISAQHSVSEAEREAAATRILSRLNWSKIREDYSQQLSKLL